MNKIRLRYSKTGKAKYISHLDLTSVMRRALLRAGIALKYSEGFNPHPYISVALPAPVGTESLCELADIGTAEELLPDGLPDLINPMLPEGLIILEAYKSERKFSDIAWLKINGKLYYDTHPVMNTAERLTQRFFADNIMIIKKTKRGSSMFDLAPFVRNITISGSGIINLEAVVSAQDPSISPIDLLSAIRNEDEPSAPDHTIFTRIDTFDKDMQVFR